MRTGQERRGRRAGRIAAAALLTVFIAPAFAADPQFTTELDPAAHDASNRANVVGTGSVTATLSGSTLSIQGNFTGLSSPATGARLAMGLGMGVPGPVIGHLTATAATSGQISGRITLDPAQVTALRQGAVYVELDSVKAPDGNSWGWFQAVAPRAAR